MLRLRAREVLDIALIVERNGVDFYDALLASTSSPRAKPIYEFMAQQERQHIQDFQRLAQEVEDFHSPESYGGEEEAYLEAMAETHMFREYGVGAKLAREAKSDAEAIRAAMQFEKDSILLFDLLKPLVPQKEERTVEALIEQEKQHLLKLRALSRTLDAS